MIKAKLARNEILSELHLKLGITPWKIVDLAQGSNPTHIIQNATKKTEKVVEGVVLKNFKNKKSKSSFHQAVYLPIYN